MTTDVRLDADSLRRTMRVYRDAVRAHASVLNLLNVYPVPDGDTGTNMARTLDSVVEELDTAEAELAPTCNAISHGSLLGARGNSGVILSQLLRGMTSVLEQRRDGTAPVVAEALDAAARAAYAAVLEPVEGTILTVARAVAEAAARASQQGATVLALLEDALAAGKEALASTPRLLPALERAGVVDAGGAGYVLLVDALLHVMDGRPLPEPDVVTEATVSAAAAPEMDGPRFEVMFLLDLPDEHVEEFRTAWSELGDSIVVVGGSGTWTCHVHTDRIGEAIEVALSVGGRPHRIEVTDLRDAGPQHEEPGLEGVRVDAICVASDRRHDSTAVVAVAAGTGLVELFLAAGAQVVVRGGQTMNPSTSELLAAVDATDADDVVMLPNNTNVVGTARQVVDLATRPVRVLATRTVTEGLAALAAFDPDAPGEANAGAMASFAERVRTGEVTRAVRAAHTTAGAPIRAGEWIGVDARGGVLEVGDSRLEVARRLLDCLLEPSSGLVTLLIGEGGGPADVESLRAWLGVNHHRVALEVHRADRPHYPFTFGVE